MRRSLLPAFPLVDRLYMPGSDVDQYGPMLKETYDPAFRNQLAEDNIAESFMRVDADNEKWEGKKRVIPVKIGRNFSSGSIGAKGALPQEGRGLWKDYEVLSRDTYCRVGFERYVMEQSKSKKGSFGEIVATEMEAAYDDYLFHRNRIMWGYGSGILCLVNGAMANATTITVDNPGNVTGAILGNRYINGNSDSGQFVAFITAGGVLQGTATVVAVSADGLSFDVDTPITCDDNCRVVIAQTPTQNSLNKEPEGILAGVDDSTFVDVYHALSRTTYPALKSTVITGVGPFSADAIQQGIDALAIRTGKNIDFFFTEHAVRRAYLATLEIDRRYTGADLRSPDSGTLVAKNNAPKVGSGKAITYGDMGMFADRDAPFRMLFGINKESWTRFVLQEGEWDNTGGDVLKWIPGFDQWTAFYRTLDNFHCQRSNVNIRWEGIDVNQIIVHPL